ncbi:hypothetical protein GTV32_21415 [Gordonia sp. SID5947]|uniref:hypothetical protein n=1 Tax=Gordonia sp. SID5947 TaxID=2690315 RepID=UPI001370B8F8|nr:hypothetical protein [Gordonia sp. SID5947]MYR08710.1 hypothetical protein [Gordonia sp. SID5947]
MTRSRAAHPPRTVRPRSGTRILSVRSAILAVGSIVVVLVVLIAVLAWQWRISSADSATATSRDELRRDAGKVVAQVFSVDGATWQADRNRARGLVGGEFAARYATELTRPPSDGARSIVWTPEVVGIVDAGPEHGDVLIRAEIVTTPVAAAGGGPGGVPITENVSVTARFDKLGERWLLTRVEVVS